MSGRLHDKTILITGGTGSFGNAMAAHAIEAGAAEVRIFSRDESKQDLMRRRFADPRLRFYLGDVRNRSSLDTACRGAELVFHAAALKQVPSCEFFPYQAVLTNVIGSLNVIEASSAAGVQSLVLLSTDKAVQPVNAMGMTKALMEKVMQAAARTLEESALSVSAVRYGNVMYSRGSVIPALVDSALRGEPFRLTHPKMTRFLLPLSVAVELVELALLKGGQGDLLIKKAPAATLEDLAQAVAEIFEVPFTTNVIGIRHGEKMHETLATREELSRAFESEDHWRIPLDDRDLNYDMFFDRGERSLIADDYTSANTERLTRSGVRDLLLSLPAVTRALSERRVWAE